MAIDAGGAPATAGSTSSVADTSANNVSGSACPHTTDHLSFRIEGNGVHDFGCGAATGKLTCTAVVTRVDSASIELHTYPPGNPCAETLTLFVSAPDFTVPLILGAYVDLEARVTETASGCAQEIKVENLPSLGGVPNPSDPRSMLWFAGADGTLSASPDSLVQVKEAPGCGAASRPGFVDQQLSFFLRGASPATVVVPMGTLHVSSAPDGTQWALHNLRSFRPDGASPADVNDFAYWIAYAAPSEP